MRTGLTTVKRKLVWLGLFWGACGGLVPAKVPTAGPPPPIDPVASPAPIRAAGSGHTRLLGLMCPRGALGRPALAALAERQATVWVGDAPSLKRAIASGRTTDLAVLGFDGKRAGWFRSAGVVQSDLAPAAAIGAYAGGLPCANEATANECQAVTGGCGLAVGSPEGDDPTPPPGPGACVLGGSLIIDVDADGHPEAFPLAALASLGEEVTGRSATLGDSCVPQFALAAGHGLDVVGVADLDGDGRAEIVLSHRTETGRRVAVYTAETPLRLTRVGYTDVK